MIPDRGSTVSDDIMTALRPFLLTLLLSVPASAALSPAAEKQLSEGVTNLYNLDYEESRRSFRKLIEMEPDSPFGYLFESGGIWWQSFMEAGLFKSTPTLQGLFEQDVEFAIRKSKALIRSRDKKIRADGYFISGMAYGTRGQWAIMKGQWLKAYFDGRRALKHLRKCIKYDKHYYDAYMGIGVYDYQVAHFKGALRLAILIGVRGNEKRGLKRLHAAMEKGRYSTKQSAAFLASIYILDSKDYNRALKVLTKLREWQPESPYFLFLDSTMRYRVGDWSGSNKGMHELFERGKKDMPRFNRKLLSLICGLVEKRCLETGMVKVSLPWFDYALENADKKDAEWITLLTLFRGNAADILGQRAKAVKDYKTVLKRPDFSSSRARAKHCLKNSCGKAATIDYLTALSHP